MSEKLEVYRLLPRSWVEIHDPGTKQLARMIVIDSFVTHNSAAPSVNKTRII
jgi:hypothetical protein